MSKIISTIIILLTLIKISFSVPCKESDYKQLFSPCGANNTRTVSIYLTEECENVQVTDPNSPLYYYSNLPVYTISCDTKCKAGEVIKYDPIQKKAICEKCPKDTYSTGGDIKINSWDDNILKNFIINCYAISLNVYKQDEDCTKLSISSDRTMISSGQLTANHLKYFIQVMYFFKSKNSGKVVLTYKKDSVKEYSYNNGDFKFFFDYDLVIADSEPDSPWRTVYYDFKPGNHEIVLFYWYYRTSKNIPLKLHIKSLEIIGIDDTAYQCEKCIGSIAPEGSDQCYSCNSNYYYDNSKKECVKCSDDMFAIPNTLQGKCMKRKKCSDFEYEVGGISECKNGKRKVEYVANQPSFCLEESKLNRTEEVECSTTKANDNTCQPGKFLISTFELDFKSQLISSFFTTNTGWKTNGKALYTGMYSNQNIEKILSKTFNIISSFAYAEINYTLNLGEDETFKIKTNTETLTLTSTSITETHRFNFEKGQNSLTFVYEKTSSNFKQENSVSINSIKIYGSNLTTEKSLIACPKGTVSDSSCSSCTACQDNEIPNKNQTECTKCINGLHKLVNGEYVCSSCPSYTYFDENKCKVNEILFQEDEKLKFNLFPMKQWLNKICSDQSGILCYENSFIGPISSKSTLNSNSNETSHDLFFMSLFEPKAVDIFDFSFDESSNKYKRGHIFGLFSVNKPVEDNKTNSEIFVEQNITFINTKIKKNIASHIAKISLVNMESKKLKMGGVIEYAEGDVCISDPSRRYKSYMFLKCNKNSISSPKVINIIDNGCTYIFEWNTPYICKNCVTKDIMYFERGVCKNGKRQIIFDELDNCLIFNSSDPTLKGYDKPSRDPLLTQEDNEYKIYLESMRNLREDDNSTKIIQIKEGENVTFPFTYIENKVYYEACSFVDNIDNNWKKYLLIIPVLYVLTLIFVICYCCKYRKIKTEYEKLRNNDTTHNESMVKGEEKDNALQINGTGGVIDSKKQ